MRSICLRMVHCLQPTLHACSLQKMGHPYASAHSICLISRLWMCCRQLASRAHSLQEKHLLGACLPECPPLQTVISCQLDHVAPHLWPHAEQLIVPFGRLRCPLWLLATRPMHHDSEPKIFGKQARCRGAGVPACYWPQMHLRCRSPRSRRDHSFPVLAAPHGSM